MCTAFFKQNSSKEILTRLHKTTIEQNCRLWNRGMESGRRLWWKPVPEMQKNHLKCKLKSVETLRTDKQGTGNKPTEMEYAQQNHYMTLK